MKLMYVILLILPLLVHTYPYPYPESKVTELDDVNVDNDEEASDQDAAHVQKRSGGSGDYLIHLKTGLLASLGQASASVASSSSAGSSGGGAYKSYGHDGGHHHYDPWSLKKSVLNTIFQALKAITGGVTALKGQLIKGSGYALRASGHVVAASGDKITNVGKVIISSASNKIQLPHSGGGGQHPFSKFSSLSAASSSSGGGKLSGHSGDGHIVHTDTVTAYEIPSGHSSYGVPKPATYSTSSHNYLPPAGGAGFSHGGHVAFESPHHHHYLPTSYIYDEHDDDFNIYGHKPITDEDKLKGTKQLEEILSQLPIGKTEYTASKTVTYSDIGNGGSSYSSSSGSSSGSNSNSDAFKEYYKPLDDVHYHAYTEDYTNEQHHPGTLDSITQTNSITTAYKGPTHDNDKLNPTPEDIYIAKHSDEDYKPITANVYSLDDTNSKQVKTKIALNDLKSILLALEADKQHSSVSDNNEKTYNYIKVPNYYGSSSYPSKTNSVSYPKISAKYDYYNKYKKPSSHGYPSHSYKKRRHVIPCLKCMQQKREVERRADITDAQNYHHLYDDNQNSLLYAPLIMGGGEFY